MFQLKSSCDVMPSIINRTGRRLRSSANNVLHNLIAFHSDRALEHLARIARFRRHQLNIHSVSLPRLKFAAVDCSSPMFWQIPCALAIDTFDGSCTKIRIQYFVNRFDWGNLSLFRLLFGRIEGASWRYFRVNHFRSTFHTLLLNTV